MNSETSITPSVPGFPPISTNQFQRDYQIDKKSFYAATNSLGYQTSNGLSSTVHKALYTYFVKQGRIKPETVKTSTVPKETGNQANQSQKEPIDLSFQPVSLSTEVKPPSNYGLVFDLGQVTEVHLHVHTTNTNQYKQMAQQAQANTQALIAQMIEQQELQGLEDAEEIEASIQAVKAALVQKRVANLSKNSDTVS